MRDILFRGKRLDNGEFLEGDLWHRPYGKSCVAVVNPIEDSGTTGGNYVIPETVGQFTGLKDKNGVMIFEGDIVRITDSLPFSPFCDGFVGEVIFCEMAFCVKKNNTVEYLYDECAEYEILGNIFDNPELLDR